MPGAFKKYHLGYAALLLFCVVLLCITPKRAAVPSGTETSVRQADTLVGSSSAVSQAASQSASSASQTQEKELVGMWIPYLSLQTAERTEEAFLANFENIARSCADYGVTALFVHVRPFADSLYPSAYFPVSHIVTGTQGAALSADLLKEMITITHGLHMEFHAWVNPLRIQTATTPQTLSESSPYRQWQADPQKAQMFLQYDGGVYFDPSYEAVRSYITQGIAEIVQNYDVDGIHIDDYFYPAADETLDEAEYSAYTGALAAGVTPLTHAQWRTANINLLVSQIYARVKSIKAGVQFGISPQGVIANNANIGADVVSWCTVGGYADYICPQLYYSLTGATVSYADALSQWQALPLAKGVKLYIGLAAYKCGGDADNSTWLTDKDILPTEIDLGRKAGSSGFVFYSYDYLQAQASAGQVQQALEYLRTGVRPAA